MLEVQKNTDGASVSNESHHQTMAIQRLGHGHDRQNQPSIQQGSQYILAITDYFTKWVEAIPMKTVTSKDVINFIKEHVIHRFGIPQTITTNGGLVFISKEFRMFVADVGIKLIRSSPYCAQANRQAEASN
jgi:transposase InsO family protein